MSYGAGVLTVTPGTRAVLRRLEPGTYLDCAHCGQRVRFRATKKDHQVIANVYGPDGCWSHVSHFHVLQGGPNCYEAAGEPHGPVRP